MSFRQICLLVIATMTLPRTAGAQHFPPAEDLRTVLRFVVEGGPAPGAVLGVLEADGTTSIVTYGSAGRGAPPLGPNSTFEIGSITKTFTATLLAEMSLRGEVGLEYPLSLYLPADVTVPSTSGREITLLDLATHRSGLPNTPRGLQIGVVAPDEEYTQADAYEFLETYELPYPPGTQRLYSNFGYALLGHVLSQAAGESFEKLIESRILHPLGMRDTGFSQDTTGGRWTRGSRQGSPVRYRTPWKFTAGSGALYSTAEDLLRYLRAHLSPPETQLHEAMRMAYQIRFPEGPEGGGHGLAWAAEVLPGESPIVGHSGGTVGYRAQARFMPDRGIATVLLTNSAEFEDNVASTLLLFDPPQGYGEIPHPPWQSCVPTSVSIQESTGTLGSISS